MNFYFEFPQWHKGNDCNIGAVQDSLSMVPVRLSVPSIPQPLDRKMFVDTTGRESLCFRETRTDPKPWFLVLFLYLAVRVCICVCVYVQMYVYMYVYKSEVQTYSVTLVSSVQHSDLTTLYYVHHTRSCGLYVTEILMKTNDWITILLRFQYKEKHTGHDSTGMYWCVIWGIWCHLPFNFSAQRIMTQMRGQWAWGLPQGLLYWK